MKQEIIKCLLYEYKTVNKAEKAPFNLDIACSHYIRSRIDFTTYLLSNCFIDLFAIRSKKNQCSGSGPAIFSIPIWVHIFSLYI